jgi:HEAT repeat protein
MRLVAVHRLRDFKSRAAFPYLRRALADADENVAVAAIKALAGTGVQEAATELAVVIARGSVKMKRAAVTALEQIGGVGIKSAVLVGMRDDDPVVRRTCIRLYAQLAGKAKTP